jgi:thiol-disulfide isomerase/thioredoxin
MIGMLAGAILLSLGWSGGDNDFVGAATTDPYLAAGIQRVSGESGVPTLVELHPLDGPVVDPAALRGKVVVVNFWATWCGPCKEEMPSLERLQRAFAPSQVQVVAITTDQQEQAMRAFAKSLGLSFPILIDQSKDVSAAFGVRGLPTTIIIGPDGHLRGRAVGPRQWDGDAAIAFLKSFLP